ncbi:50S ribosomal protein L4 [Vulgatibacter incomptus]|uniref:Large ribosomal subunit protein uL4 n=1 Tax=Vulgatibacter incomptus TaxID=1391653 RepID=A0A0K1PDG9_9BACT|nr:50S ribosomal protein L4 [Vulgatibacter incomptus]AKU91588.1 LSU ribosomal protein L4p (L1e) [Vulgatibacter incomptus]
MATFDVYNLEKQKVGTIDLADSVFASEVNQNLIYEVAKMQQINRRRGTVGVKNRSLVSGGGKKPWKQKGTGRARQGSIRASQWVGGGKAMAPKSRDYTYRPPAKVRKGALRSVLSLRAQEGKILVVDNFDLGELKTQKALQTLTGKLGLGSALVVVAGAPGDKAREFAIKSIRNLAAFDALPAEGFNLEDALRHSDLVLTSAAAKQLEGALS